MLMLGIDSCSVLHNSSIKDICIKCGMDRPCAAMIITGEHYKNFEYKQSACPNKYLYHLWKLSKLMSRVDGIALYMGPI